MNSQSTGSSARPGVVQTDRSRATTSRMRRMLGVSSEVGDGSARIIA